jgi:MATE family multidrug resistance protein
LEKPNYKRISDFLKLGIPIGLSSLIESSSLSLAALFIARFGVVATASYEIALSVLNALYMIPFCLSMALSVRIAQQLGERNSMQALLIAKVGLFFFWQRFFCLCR